MEQPTLAIERGALGAVVGSVVRRFSRSAARSRVRHKSHGWVLNQVTPSFAESLIGYFRTSRNSFGLSHLNSAALTNAAHYSDNTLNDQYHFRGEQAQIHGPIQVEKSLRLLFLDTYAPLHLHAIAMSGETNASPPAQRQKAENLNDQLGVIVSAPHRCRLARPC